MRHRWFTHLALTVVSLFSAVGITATGFCDEPKSDDGFEAIFNGKDLTSWKGNSENWSVQDEAITGISTAEKPLAGNTFIVFEGSKVADFELRLEYRIVAGNSGIQYRSKLIDADKFIVGGYQADIDSSPRYSGINYEERMRGILAERGESVLITKDDKKSVVGTLGDRDVLQELIKKEDWNQYRIVAKGNLVQHYINDKLMSEVDDQSEKGAKEGILALQLHAGPPMKVQFRKIMLKKL